MCQPEERPVRDSEQPLENATKRNNVADTVNPRPIFHEIKVTGHDVCTVYACVYIFRLGQYASMLIKNHFRNLKCDTKVREFRAGVHEITNVVFKSIKCAVSEEL